MPPPSRARSWIVLSCGLVSSLLVLSVCLAWSDGWRGDKRLNTGRGSIKRDLLSRRAGDPSGNVYPYIRIYICITYISSTRGRGMNVRERERGRGEGKVKSDYHQRDAHLLGDG